MTKKIIEPIEVKAEVELTDKERIEGFKKDLAIARDKWKVDIGAVVRPVLQFVNLKEKEPGIENPNEQAV